MASSNETITVELLYSETFADDDNGVTRHISKIRLKILNEDLLVWKFNLDNLNEETFCCSVVNRKVDLEKFGDEAKLPHGLKFALEEIDLLSSENGQRRSTFTLYISRKPSSEASDGEGKSPPMGLFGKALSSVECSCTKEENEGGSFTPTKMFELDQASPCAICIYKHSPVKCTPKTIDIQLELFDFSKATKIPFEVQEALAKKDCLKDTSSLLTTWLTPFDITIQCNDGYKIRAHKAILSARSPVFSRMFGNKDKKVKVEEDVQYAPMEVVLQFIYSGSLHRYWKYQPEEVLEAASNYELSQLIQFFDTLLPQICTNENALKLLKLAEEHELNNARKQIFNYISKNFGDVFKKSVSFDWK